MRILGPLQFYTRQWSIYIISLLSDSIINLDKSLCDAWLCSIHLFDAVADGITGNLLIDQSL